MATQPSRPGMIGRVQRILLKPKEEWEAIDAEPMTVGGIMTGWVLLLAAIGPIAGLIGGLVFGYGFFGISYRPSVMGAVSSAVISYCVALIGIYLFAWIINALAPNFGGQKNSVQAMKVAAFSATAAYVAGIFQIIPMLGWLGILGLYSLYLLYLGLPRLMRANPEQATTYTVVTVIAAIVMWIVIGAVATAISSTFVPRYGPSSIGSTTGTMTIPGLGSVDLGKLDEAAKKAEATAKGLEQRAAGGGATGPVEAIAGERLQAMLPASIGGWQRTSIESQSMNAGGFGGSSAEARYEMGDDRITLRVTDIASAGALGAMASAFNIQSNKTTDDGYERVGQVDGRMTTEEWSNGRRRGKYGTLVANRFMVEASGTAPSVDAFKQAVASVNLGQLEAMAR